MTIKKLDLSTSEAVTKMESSNGDVVQTKAFQLGKGGDRMGWINLYKKLGQARYTALETTFQNDLTAGKLIMGITDPEVKGIDSTVVFAEADTGEIIAYFSNARNKSYTPEEVLQIFRDGSVKMSSFDLSKEYKPASDNCPSGDLPKDALDN